MQLELKEKGCPNPWSINSFLNKMTSKIKVKEKKSQIKMLLTVFLSISIVNFPR